MINGRWRSARGKRAKSILVWWPRASKVKARQPYRLARRGWENSRHPVSGHASIAKTPQMRKAIR